VLSLNAVRASGREDVFTVQPVSLGGREQLATSLWLATSAQRPRGPLLDQASTLLVELLHQTLAASPPAAARRADRPAAPESLRAAGP
jgi:LysR family nitrogen assimilation transcriptional regulator